MKVYGVSKLSDEAFRTLARAAKQAKRVLEIGTYHGATAAKLAAVAPEAVVTSLDIFRGVSATNWFRNRRRNQRLYVGTAQQLEAEGAAGFDLIFVDADHRHGPCLADLHCAERMLAPGGRLFVHDYDLGRWPGVVKAVEEFTASPVWRGSGVADLLMELVREP